MIVWYPCGIPSRDLFVTPVCVRSVHHLYQWPEFLVTVMLVITLVMYMMILVIISNRNCIWVAV